MSVGDVWAALAQYFPGYPDRWIPPGQDRHVYVVADRQEWPIQSLTYYDYRTDRPVILVPGDEPAELTGMIAMMGNLWQHNPAAPIYVVPGDDHSMAYDIAAVTRQGQDIRIEFDPLTGGVGEPSSLVWGT